MSASEWAHRSERDPDGLRKLGRNVGTDVVSRRDIGLIRRHAGAPPSPAFMLALQRTLGNRAAVRLAGLGAPAGTGLIQVQRLEDRYSVAEFKDPIKSLKGAQSQHKVSEDPGSQGIGGVPDKEMIDKLKVGATRKNLLAQYRLQLTAWRTQETQLSGTQPGQDAKNNADLLDLVIADIEKIGKHDPSKKVQESPTVQAAKVYKQNTLRMSKIGLGAETTHNQGLAAGTKGRKAFVFHRDAGIIKINPGDLGGDTKDQNNKAELLNGPFKRGYVKGHGTIDNYKHRFIEHVHVNKGEPLDAIDIYNASKADGAKVAAWITKNGKELTNAQNLSATQIEAANRARDAEDLKPYE